MSDKNSFNHEKIETHSFLMVVLIVLVIAIGGLVEIVPLFFQKSTTQALEGVVPLNALQLAGRDVYVREGCYNCHSQMIRPFRSETLRYGHYSVAGEFVYDHPFQWGSKRTGPDLHRVGGKYSDDWHQAHLINPRDLVDDSLALADRFGLSLGFHACSQDDYLAIVRGYAAEYGLALDEHEALEWAKRRGARSGRVAWHFITELAGRAGRALG